MQASEIMNKIKEISHDRDQVTYEDGKIRILFEKRISTLSSFFSYSYRVYIKRRIFLFPSSWVLVFSATDMNSYKGRETEIIHFENGEWANILFNSSISL